MEAQRNTVPEDQGISQEALNFVLGVAENADALKVTGENTQLQLEEVLNS